MTVELKESERTYLIADLPTGERPRERLAKRGSESLSNVELLAIILRSGPPGRSTIDLARELLYDFDNNLGRLARATIPELCKIHGIGPAKAAELKATFALAQRLVEHVEPERLRVDSPEDAAAYFRELMRGKKQEELRCLLLDTRNHVIGDVTVTVGLLNQSQAHAREVFRAAIHESAAKIVLVHNHPSGDPTPSKADIELTKMLYEAGKVVGIQLVDHVIIGERTAHRAVDHVSLRRLGLLGES